MTRVFRADDQTPANRSRAAQPLGRRAAKRLGYCVRCKHPFVAGDYAAPDKQAQTRGLMYCHMNGGCR